MTTIAANKREMVSDSRCSWDNEFVSAHKVFRIRDCVVGLAGSHNEGMKFLEWFKSGGTPPEFNDERSFEAVVLSRAGIDVYINAIYPMRVLEPFYCTGSGGMAAKAAMICGKSPAEAVAIAMKCDKNTGGKIRSFTLKPDADSSRK